MVGVKWISSQVSKDIRWLMLGKSSRWWRPIYSKSFRLALNPTSFCVPHVSQNNDEALQLSERGKNIEILTAKSMVHR